MKIKNFALICSVIALVFSMFLFVPSVFAFEEHRPNLHPQIERGYNQQGPPPSNNQPGYYDDFMARWDRNRNGVVTKKEYKGPSRTFKMMDRNHNGVIDRGEAVSYSSHNGGGFNSGNPVRTNRLFCDRLKNNWIRW